jgi:acyl carrier protein
MIKMKTRKEIAKICHDSFVEAAIGLDVPTLSPEKQIASDLDIDSIHVLEAMIIIEDKLEGIMLDAEEFQNAITIGDLYNLIGIKIKQQIEIEKLYKEVSDNEFAKSKLMDQLFEDKQNKTGIYGQELADEALKELEQ